MMLYLWLCMITPHNLLAKGDAVLQLIYLACLTQDLLPSQRRTPTTMPTATLFLRAQSPRRPSSRYVSGDITLAM